MRALSLIIARHGNTFEADETPTQVGARTDLSLTAAGQAQAIQLGIYLEANFTPIQAIYCGDLKRQQQTAQLIQQQLKEAPLCQMDSALDEIDYGDWEGLTSEMIQKDWAEEYVAWGQSAKWPENIFGTSFEQHRQAVSEFLDYLHRQHAPGETVLAVSSQGIIRLFLNQIPEIWQEITEKNAAEDYKVKTGHFCHLLVTPSDIEVVSWNVRP
jgi:broad specificity phosphatase PhoE